MKFIKLTLTNYIFIADLYSYIIYDINMNIPSVANHWQDTGMNFQPINLVVAARLIQSAADICKSHDDIMYV